MRGRGGKRGRGGGVGGSSRRFSIIVSCSYRIFLPVLRCLDQPARFYSHKLVIYLS